jgi:hypothetical protein
MDVIPIMCQAWLWVAVTPLVTFFQITLSRCTDTAKNLLGENFGGILNSDRYAAYNVLWLGAATVMLGTLEKRIHQNIGAPWSFQGSRKCSGSTTRKII